MTGQVRWSIYAMLIAVSTGMMLARVARVHSPDPKSPTPFLSANDRSRWATIRALGDDGTYVIDKIVFDKQGHPARGWQTIDMVRHRGADGREHYYSSKPTLLTTLLAGEYWLIKVATGTTLADDPFYIGRLMLVLTNVLPLAAALIGLTWLFDRWSASDWTRVFAVTAACFATFVTTFAVTLNNHSIAAICLVFALVVTLPIFQLERREWWRFAAAGLMLGFLAANELPALSLTLLIAIGMARKCAQRTAVVFAPLAILVAAAAFGTNILAHGDWRTPYAHRGVGDNWYDYPGSYWLAENLRGIDRGESSPAVYAFNVLIGHHGLFSLTPIWLLSAIGCGMWLKRGDSAQRAIALTTALITIIVVGFYLTRPQIDRNYGGGTCCLRWLIWLTPLWLLTLLPTADWLSQSRWGRAAAVALLAVSVFSANYASDNPWSHPWVFDYWTAMGWIKY